MRRERERENPFAEFWENNLYLTLALDFHKRLGENMFNVASSHSNSLLTDIARLKLGEEKI